MKARQSSIIRWVAKLVTKGTQASAQKKQQIRTLDVEQLREVSGGTSQGPNKGW